MMLNFEICEGKEVDGKKKFMGPHTATTACTLRVLEPWFGTRKVAIADAWFGNFRTAV
jgi:hypothetical protein